MSATIPVRPEQSRREPPDHPEHSQREPPARPELVEGHSLCERLPLLASAPGGIKKLRELILELAVRGKLVPQDPSDEPASKLLERIQAERLRMEEAGVLKKTPLLQISEDDKPYNTPAGWAWVRLGGLLSKIGAGSTPLGGKKAYVSEGVKFLRSQNVWDEGLRLSGAALIPPVVHQKMSGTHVQAGDLLFNITGASIGRCALVPDNFDVANVSQHVSIIRPIDADTRFFLHKLLVSRYVQKMVMDVQVGVSREGLSIRKLSQFVIPLPPLAEQHRIIAKVDELMALCDRLEAQQEDAEAAHATLVKTLLDTLTQSQTAEDFAANWQRLSAHFDTLFTTESSIDALKQTLLQLAVMGKLVPQDPNDEPAAEMLERGKVEKSRQVGAKAKEARAAKSLAQSGPDEPPFELPSGWSWAKFGDLVLHSEAGWSPSCEAKAASWGEWGVLKVSAVSWGAFCPGENKALPAHLSPRKEYEVVQGDFLISRANTAELVARSVIVDDTPPCLLLSDKIIRLRLSGHVMPSYCQLVNSTRFSRRYYVSVAGGTSSSMKNVSRAQILSLPIPVPPLAEQHRIVARHGELAALCDRLKARLTDSRTAHERFADALAAQVTAA